MNPQNSRTGDFKHAGPEKGREEQMNHHAEQQERRFQVRQVSGHMRNKPENDTRLLAQARPRDVHTSLQLHEA